VSGVLFGGFALQSFAWLVELFPARTYPTLNEWLVYWQRIGPGLAGIGIGRNPDGVVVQVSSDLDEKKRKKAEKAAAASADEPPDPAESGDRPPLTVAGGGA